MKTEVEEKVLMRALGIETSGSVCSVAYAQFAGGGRLGLRELVAGSRISEMNLDGGPQRRSEAIYGLLDRVLANSGGSLGGLDLVAVSVGPGSFTGLRVGVTIAKVFAKFGGLNLVAVPTLEAMAAQTALGSASPLGRCCYWVPFMDAKRDEVYSAFYREKGGRMTKEKGPWVGRVSELMAAIPKGSCPVSEPARASIVAVLGMERLLRGHKDNPDRLVPLYLKRPEAVEKLRAGLLGKGKAWRR